MPRKRPRSPAPVCEVHLIRLASSSVVEGSQRLKGFKVDGDGRRLHGGISVNWRNHVTLEQVEVTGTHFNAVWLLNGTDMVVRDVRLINTAWASTAWRSRSPGPVFPYRCSTASFSEPLAGAR